MVAADFERTVRGGFGAEDIIEKSMHVVCVIIYIIMVRGEGSAE